jgi:hypothetical protein
VKKKYLKLLYVEWADHWSGKDSAWYFIEDLELEPLICRSVGWLVAETKDVLVLSATLDPNGKTGQRMNILKSCIKKRRIIK